DAMDKIGTIEIEVADNKDGIIILIRDSGTGIKGEIMDKIFNPFFTTKTRGTGLGLSIVKRLIDSLEGSIDIKNLMPKGTEVRLFIKDKKDE
ncbi:MAG: ATP-binding protein, partial [Thermodesulfovibrionales bacterium]|nr:ATP-binding protein [Thermodesulfovibrionales bacterium]